MGSGEKILNLDLLQDTILWNEFRAGNKKSFDQIYKSYVKPLYYYGLKFTHNKELVLDCIQDVFLDLMTHLKTLGDTNNIKLYLFVSMKRKIIRSLQKENHIKLVSDDQLQFLSNYSFEPERNDTDDEMGKMILLRDALDRLPVRQKEAIYLRFVIELEYEGMCLILNLNYQSVRNLIHRAIKNLRNLLTCLILLFCIFC